MRKVTECYTAAGEPQAPDANGLFTLATRKESWLTVAQRRNATATPLAVNVLQASASGVGDMSSTDSWFLLGGDYWGNRHANQTGGIGLPLVVFEGTPAENRYAVRIAELPVLQAQLEAYEP